MAGRCEEEVEVGTKCEWAASFCKSLHVLGKK
jgi:hypothetical protein